MVDKMQIKKEVRMPEPIWSEEINVSRKSFLVMAYSGSAGLDFTLTELIARRCRLDGHSWEMLTLSEANEIKSNHRLFLEFIEIFDGYKNLVWGYIRDSEPENGRVASICFARDSINDYFICDAGSRLKPANAASVVILKRVNKDAADSAHDLKKFERTKSSE